MVGFGKAVLGMAAATADLLAGFVVSGVLSLPYGISRIGTVHYSNLINKIFVLRLELLLLLCKIIFLLRFPLLFC